MGPNIGPGEGSPQGGGFGRSCPSESACYRKAVSPWLRLGCLHGHWKSAVELRIVSSQDFDRMVAFLNRCISFQGQRLLSLPFITRNS